MDLSNNVIAPVIVIIIVAILSIIWKSFRTFAWSVIKSCWHIIIFPYSVKKRINKLEKSARLLGWVVIETLIPLSNDNKVYTTAFAFLIIVSDIEAREKRESDAKKMLSAAIGHLNHVEPPLIFEKPDTEVKVLKAIEAIKSRSKIYTLEIEQIEKLYKEKKFPPKTPELPNPTK